MRKSKLWVVPIEPLENRYTGHWFKYLPEQLSANIKNFDVEQIDIQWKPMPTKKGEFLNFGDTVRFKNAQSIYIATMFMEGDIQANDVFLFTDAWNPTITYLRYLSITYQIPILIYGIWHAGAYDENDILGQRKKQSYDGATRMHHIEKSLLTSIDFNIFATHYHEQLFANEFSSYKNETSFIERPRTYVTGFPMEYYKDKVVLPNNHPKEKIVLFPHRKSKEKHPEIFHGLREFMPGYELIFTQDVCKNKEEYHNLLSRAEYCFSASDQETFGISMYEAALAGCKPIVPNKLSYKELWFECFRYNDLYDIPAMLEGMTYDRLNSNVQKLNQEYFHGNRLYSLIDDPRNYKKSPMKPIKEFLSPMESAFIYDAG
jgi:hypothetical protein